MPRTKAVAANVLHLYRAFQKSHPLQHPEGCRVEMITKTE